MPSSLLATVTVIDSIGRIPTLGEQPPSILPISRLVEEGGILPSFATRAGQPAFTPHCSGLTQSSMWQGRGISLHQWGSQVLPPHHSSLLYHALLWVSWLAWAARENWRGRNQARESLCMLSSQSLQPPLEQHGWWFRNWSGWELGMQRLSPARIVAPSGFPLPFHCPTEWQSGKLKSSSWEQSLGKASLAQLPAPPCQPTTQLARGLARESRCEPANSLPFPLTRACPLRGKSQRAVVAAPLTSWSTVQGRAAAFDAFSRSGWPGPDSGSSLSSSQDVKVGEILQIFNFLGETLQGVI